MLYFIIMVVCFTNAVLGTDSTGAVGKYPGIYVLYVGKSIILVSNIIYNKMLMQVVIINS